MESLPHLLAAGQGQAALLTALTMLGTFALIGGITLLILKREAKRSARIGALMMPRGFSFVPKPSPEEHSRILGGFRLGQLGSGRTLTNLSAKLPDADEEVLLFESGFTQGSGKHSTTYRQTVLRLTSARFHLPEFHLNPETMLNRIGHAIGMQDIDFDAFPLFSKSYQLKGPDEAAIRSFFDASLLSALERQPGLTIEGAGNQLLIYRMGKRRRPEEFQSFLEEGLLGVLFSRGP